MTIRHVVSWRLAATETAEKATHAAEVASRLTALRGVVDEIRSLQVGSDVVGGANWDVVLIADFDDVAAVGRYQVHPAHQEVAAYIRSVVAERSCVDIEV